MNGINRVLVKDENPGLLIRFEKSSGTALWLGQWVHYAYDEKIQVKVVCPNRTKIIPPSILNKFADAIVLYYYCNKETLFLAHIPNDEN